MRNGKMKGEVAAQEWPISQARSTPRSSRTDRVGGVPPCRIRAGVPLSASQPTSEPPSTSRENSADRILEIPLLELQSGE
jgi:hypothetical protein